MTTWEERRRASRRQWENHYNAMTLGEADSLLRNPIGCACVGSPPGFGWCFCRLTHAQASALQRGAHIVAKLLDDASRGSPPLA